MEFYELLVSVLLEKSIHHLSMHEMLGHWISKSHLKVAQLRTEHYERKYKHYVFSSLYPLEKDGVYKSGRVYVLTIRSSVRDLLRLIEGGIRALKGDDFMQVVSMEHRKRSFSHVSELVTVTPTIVTVDHKPWMSSDSIELLQNQLQANAEKKLRTLFPEEALNVEQSFIQGIRLENRKPIAITYKGKKLIGNKFKLFIQDDPVSQRLANIVLGSGLAEKNSALGTGFCLPKFV